jgi:hypothetical protein
MKKITAEKILPIVIKQLNIFCDEDDLLTKNSLEELWKETDIIERDFNIKIEESNNYKGSFHITIYTDGRFYDLFANQSEDSGFELQKRLTEEIKKVVKSKDYDGHYEHDVGCVLYMY